MAAVLPGFAPIAQGGWGLRLADPADMPALLDLRARAFGRAPGLDDSDPEDAACLHFHVSRGAAAPVATLRLRLHTSGASLQGGYAARFYDLRALAGAGGVALELGRLCADPGLPAADALRLIWAGVARLARQAGAARLVGCTSFQGTDPGPLAPALALLAARHLGPAALRPGVRAPETLPLTASAADPAAAALLPPLLRFYLSLGGWVSDHLVIDRDLGTCHVFTCVEIDRLPPARRALFERLAAG
jgi:putative hemolysin